jgi:hypothetical protein
MRVARECRDNLLSPPGEFGARDSRVDDIVDDIIDFATKRI